MNPYMPGTAFVPDGEPRVFEHNGERRVYIYGSRDDTITDYCGLGHDVWSASVENLTDWTNHGEAFSLSQIQELGHGIIPNNGFQILAAPDCVYNPKTKKYYLYTFLGKGDPKTSEKEPPWELKIWVAESGSPIGPFVNPIGCPWPYLGAGKAFDPAVLVDWDGKNTDTVRVYAYWGFRTSNNCMAEVDAENMNVIKEDTLVKAPYGTPCFFEASSIRKVGDKYVFIYSGMGTEEPLYPDVILEPNTLYYSYADHPLGNPAARTKSNQSGRAWTFGGAVISNKGRLIPETDNSWSWTYGNNHGGLFEIDGQWFVNYHRPAPDSFNRQAMMEPVEISYEPGVGGKVTIEQAQMTSSGVEFDGLNAFKRYNASITCYKESTLMQEGKTVEIAVAGDLRPADGKLPVINIGNGSILGYEYMNFGKAPITNDKNLIFKCSIKTPQNGYLEVLISDPNNPLDDVINHTKTVVGKIDFERNNDWYELEGALCKIDACKLPLVGKRGVYLKFSGFCGGDKEVAQLEEIEFSFK